MIPILRLIRWQNLLIVAATQYIMRWCVIYPIIEHKYNPVFLDNFGKALHLQLGEFYFFLLVLATLCITAAGYVINDYFDRKNDLINRPNTVVIERFISPRKAMVLHWTLNSLGVILGGIVSWHIGYVNLTLIFVFATGLLWFYSTDFNRKFFIGNVIVALLTALVPFLVAIYEIIPLNIVYRNGLRLLYLNFNGIFFWILAFTYFAFITTLIREIIKDMEDLMGDESFGSKSLPIVLGIPATKTIVIGLLAIVIASVCGGMGLYVHDLWSRIYLLVFVVAPILFVGFKLIKASSVSDYSFASRMMKFIMVTGILYAVLLALLMNNSLI